jgi:predicted Holliday junction resolvase-like endonuclease
MDVENIIRNLKEANLIAQCPSCSREFKLSDSLLFDGMKKFPEPAEEKKLLLIKELEERKGELEKRKISADIKAEKKAIEVGFGKIIENFVPAYKNLKLKFCECRPLYEPIDIIVFNGLIKSKVDFITFLEIKSGNSKLSQGQKLIKEAILDGKVDLKVL